MTLLLQERELDHSGSCKTDITKAPSRELQPHNITVAYYLFCGQILSWYKSGQVSSLQQSKADLCQLTVWPGMLSTCTMLVFKEAH